MKRRGNNPGSTARRAPALLETRAHSTWMRAKVSDTLRVAQPTRSLIQRAPSYAGWAKTCKCRSQRVLLTTPAVGFRFPGTASLGIIGALHSRRGRTHVVQEPASLPLHQTARSYPGGVGGTADRKAVPASRQAPAGNHGLHATGGYLMLCARREEKILPAAAVRELLWRRARDARCAAERNSA